MALLPRLEIEKRMADDGLGWELSGQLIWFATEGEQIDRPHSVGWIMDWRPANERLLQRFGRAIMAGDAIRKYEIKTDINGKTYVSSDWNKTAFPMGKYMNEWLTKLGY